MELVLKLLHFKRQGFDLIGKELVRRLQFSGIIRRCVKVLQHIVLIRRFACSRNPAAKIATVDYPTLSGRHVLCGMRQSMPSSSMDSCAGVMLIFPSFAAGQTNRPFSRRFENKHAPLRNPPDDFEEIAATTTEHEQMPGVRVFSQDLLSLRS